MSRRSRRRRDPPFSLFAFQDIIAAVTGVMVLMTMLLILDLVTQVFAIPSAAEASPTADPAANELSQLLAQREALAQELARRAEDAPSAPITRTQLEYAERLTRAAEAEAEAMRTQMAEAAAEQRRLDRQTQAMSMQTQTEREATAEAEKQLAGELSRTRVTLLEGQARGKQVWFVLCGAGPVAVAEVTAERELQPRQTFDGTDGFMRWVDTLSPSDSTVVLLVQAEGVERFEALQRALRQRRFEVGWDLATPEIAAALGRDAAGGGP